jgi:ATP phosphoribosyltransferase
MSCGQRQAGACHQFQCLVGLADLIVDIIETGNTLRANGLVEQRVIMHSQAVLVVNRAAYHLKGTAVQNVIHCLRQALQTAAASNQATSSKSKASSQA